MLKQILKHGKIFSCDKLCQSGAKVQCFGHTFYYQRIMTVALYAKSSPTTHLRRHRRERRYSSYLFMTSALDGGEWSVSSPGVLHTPGKEPRIPI
jgi:hypothetical protein